MQTGFQQILTFLLAIWMLVFFGACKETAPKSAEELLDAPQEKPTEEGQDNSLSYPWVDSIQVLAEIDRTAMPFNGRFFSALSWNDQLGSNTLILSEKGAYDQGNGRKEIFAYHYVKKDNLYDVLWQINDFVDGDGCDLNIDLINVFPLISDVDSNGIAESAIFYSLNNRCDAVTFPAKLIVHEGADRFTIRGLRGQFLGPSEALMNKYRAENDLPPIKYKNLDTDNSKLDTSIINYYAQQWDRFISLENKWKGALPDSLIKPIN